MDRTSLTSIEKQTLKEHADRMMDQWVALRENLKEADRSTVSKFCLYLQILALSLYPDYNAKEARELLARDEISMLRTFFEKDDGPDPESVDHAQADHIIALAHGLFEASGGQESAFWDQFNDEHSSFKNQSICGFMVDATGMNSLEGAHAEQLYHAILKSKLLPRNVTFSFTMFQKEFRIARMLSTQTGIRELSSDRAAGKSHECAAKASKQSAAGNDVYGKPGV